eukprot:jgi/Tetstr1/459353/TSEL_000422.t1
MVECFEEAYALEPQHYKNTAFGSTTSSRSVGSRVWTEAWDQKYPSVKYCERGDSEKHGVGRLVRGYVFLTMRAMEL